MSEEKTTSQINWKGTCILGLRFLQMLALSATVVGFIWGAGDWITAMLPKDSVITPTSILLMLYGLIGSSVIELAIRVVQRKK